MSDAQARTPATTWHLFETDALYLIDYTVNQSTQYLFTPESETSRDD